MQVGMNIDGRTTDYYEKADTSGKEEKKSPASFQERLTTKAEPKDLSHAGNKKTVHATEEYKKRHPDQAAHVDRQIALGKKVLGQNGVEDVSREDMTMEEYKAFFTDLMNRIPYDWSQKNDVNVWTITEEGWEQMKNDPDYEAWVLGYTAEDRAVHNPFASMTGYAPRFHTEHFGASIEEHLGQSFSMGSSKTGKSNGDDEESWWDKRQKRMKKYLKEQQEIAAKKSAAWKKAQQAKWLQEHTEERIRLRQYFEERSAKESGEPYSRTHVQAGAAANLYESLFYQFSNSVISKGKDF